MKHLTIVTSVAIACSASITAQRERLRGVADAVVAAIAPAVDAPDAVARSLLASAQDASKSAAAVVALDLAVQSTALLADPAGILERIDALLARDPHGLAEVRAREWKSRILRTLGRFEEADRVAPYAGFVDRLAVAGPFPIAANDGTGVLLPAELEFPREHTIRRRLPNERSIDVEKRGALVTRGCYVAADDFRVPHDTGAYVEISTESSFVCYLDGERIASVLRPARRDPERLYVPVRLGAGGHRLVIKLATPSEHRLALRYVDAAGRPLEFDRTTATESLAGAGNAPELPAFRTGCDMLLDAATDVETEPAIAIAALRACLDAGRMTEATEIALAFEQAPPRAAHHKAALAATLDAVSMIPAELRTAHVRRLLDEAGGELVDHHFMQLRSARLLRDEDRVEDAITLLRERLERHPHEPATHAALVSALSHLDFDADASLALRAWMELVPQDLRPIQRIATQRTNGGDVRGAFDLLTTALQRRPGARGLRQQLLSLAIRLGETETRDAIVRTLHRHDPDGIHALRLRLSVMERSGDEAGAQTAASALLRHEHVTPADLKRVAASLARAGAPEAASAIYDRVLKIDPSNADARRALSHFGSSDEFPWIARFRRDGLGAAAAFEPSEHEAEASSTLVIDQLIVRVFADGSYVRETHVLRRINDRRGVEAYSDANTAARADEVLEIRTLTADGQEFVPARVDGTYTMPQLQPGRFVDTRHRDFGFAAPDRPLRGPSFFFQGASEPYRLTEFVAILPPSHRGEIRTRRLGAPTEEIELPNGHRAVVFRRTNVPRLAAEPLSPPLGDLVPALAFGEDDALVTTARDAYVSALRLTRGSAWVDREANRICSGVEGDLAKARALHAWVHAEIADGRGADPTSVLLRRRGTRFFLFVAMLEAVEVPLRHAVTAAAIEGLEDEATPLFRGTSRFPVPAVRIEPRDADPLWVAVDHARFEPLGSIAPERRGAAAILLDLDRHELVRLPGDHRAADLGWRFSGALTLLDDGDARLEIDGEKLGDIGFGLAEQVRNLPQAHRAAVARQIASQVLTGWTIERAELGDLEPGRRLAFRAGLSQRGAVRTGDLLALPISPLQLVASFAANAERTLPVQLPVLDADDWCITIDPGSAYRIVDVPAGIDIRSSWMDYSLTFTRRGRSIVVRRRMEQRPGLVSVADYADFRRTLQAIDRAEAEHVRVARR